MDLCGSTSEEVSQQGILQYGYKHFDGKPIVVSAWSLNMQVDEEEIAQISVWVQFPKLPLKYWNPKVLCKLANQSGSLWKLII